MYDKHTPIDQFLSATAAKQPTPGGGSVTALVGALACSIGEMTVQYSIGKKGLEAFQEEFKPAVAELARARDMLLQLMAEDQLAYEALTAARKLPQGAPDRDAKIAAALLVCIRVPESIAATGVAILERVDKLLNFINVYLLSDLAVSADLAMASIRCAVYNVRANLPALTDASDRQKVEATIGQILQHALALIQNVAPRIQERIARGA